MFAKEDSVDQASFKADHTIDICSQQPGTLSIQPFLMDELIKLLLVIICFPSRFEIKLKNSFPSTFLDVKRTRWFGFGYIMLHGISPL